MLFFRHKNMKKIFLIFSIILMCLNLLSQNDTIKNKQLNVFLDCSYYCDEAFIKEKITYINYVRDRKEADLHILITQENNGSGGYNYTFFFIGLKKFSTKSDTLILSLSFDVTTDEKRLQFVKILKLGLTQFVIHTSVYNDLSIEYDKPTENEVIIDKWNYWVFDISSDCFINGDANYSEFYLYSSLSATKVTENWKLSFSAGNNYNKSIYEYDGEEIIGLNTSYYNQNKIVKSINNHFSLGGIVSVSNSSYSNYKFFLKVHPAIEYDLFPYSKSNRKIFTATYSVGYQYMNFYDTTIYNKIEEKLLAQEFILYYKTIQKWGNINISAKESNYLHDFSKNRLDISTTINLRVFKGVSVYVNGGYSFIHNQLSIPKNNADIEDILLQQRMLATSYSYWASIGISFTFGSIYNNIVNPRMTNWNI